MRNGLAKQLIGLGAAQVVIGVLCIIFQAAALMIFTSGYYATLDPIGHGIWTGILFIIAGAFGIAGGRKRNRCRVVAFNVLSILSASFAACLLGIAIPGAMIYASHSYNCKYDKNYYYGSSRRCSYSGSEDSGTAMEALMAILALAEGIIAIWSSVICCKIGACCCNCGDSPSPLHSQFVMAGQTYQGQQQIIMDNQQSQMLLPNQPPPYSPSWQQPTSLPSHQQLPNIDLDPRQQMAQYSSQDPNLPPYSDCQK